MINISEIKKALLVSLWFAFLTLPIVVIRVNTIEDTIEWRWHNMILVALTSFILSFLWTYLIKRREFKLKKEEADTDIRQSFIQHIFINKRYSMPAIAALMIFALIFPFLFSSYQTNIMISALIFIMLGLGLNIIVGLTGLLMLGYAAFYSVGAYSYALLNYHFGMGFWTVLPIAAVLSTVFGIVLGFPLLRLRGDYLAIVTLAFGEIIYIVLQNWNEFSFGPSGIANIPRPSFFGLTLSLDAVIIYIYYIMIVLCILTVFVVNRLKNSRIGRAWMALREDEIACEAMGIDKIKTKLSAFALGATWAGIGGVVFAAKTTFVNPASFTIWESILILCIVVLGGMGSVFGVIVGAFILILLPEYLRALSEYRMLAFGLVLALMMVFRPMGIISNVRRIYHFNSESGAGK
jgi:branched-chain amino acid transport system permease protein